MGENDFKVGEKVAWSYMGKDVPGVVKDKSEGKITADSGGKQINRNGEPGNPAYVLAMDKGDSKDGKEVAKKGSNLHAREDNGGSDAEGNDGNGDDKSGQPKNGNGDDKQGNDKGSNGGGGEPFISNDVAEAAPAPQNADGLMNLDEKVLEADEMAGGGKAEEEALEAQLEAGDDAAEATDAAAEADEGARDDKPAEAATTRLDTAMAEEEEEEEEGEGGQKRKPLDAPVTRGDAAKVAKKGGPASNLRSNN